MTNNRILRVVAALAVVLIGAAMFPVAAFAYTPPEAERTEEPAAEAEQTPAPAATYEPKPLTPEGNLTLVDDISGEAAGDKQFITVITKSGAYFYLVIDRADDRENVHFLNLVDEADLLAIMEGEKTVTPAAANTAPAEPEPTPEPATEPEPEKKSNMGGILVSVLLVAALGGGAFWFFKIRKPKAASGATPLSELDEFAFDADGDGDDLFDDDANNYGGEVPEFEAGDGDLGGDMPEGETGADNDAGDYMPDFGAYDESEGKE
jgi:flagellar basal body-associated protein FliL